MRIDFRKLYQRVSDYGYSYNAIILFEKIAEKQEVVHLTGQAKEQFGADTYVITTQYRCRLRIDLWLFILEIEWRRSN